MGVTSDFEGAKGQKGSVFYAEKYKNNTFNWLGLLYRKGSSSDEISKSLKARSTASS